MLLPAGRAAPETSATTKGRTNRDKDLHVRGNKEEGTTTTRFDMVVMNDLDR